MAPFTNDAQITDAPYADEDSDPSDGNDDVIDREDPADSSIDEEDGDTDDHDIAVWAGPVVDVELVKTLTTAAPYAVGDTVTYEIVVENKGPATATNISVEDTLPTGLTYVSSDMGGVNVGQTVLWTIDSMEADTSVTLTISAKIDAGATGDLTNFAEVTGHDQTDIDSQPGENPLNGTNAADQDEEDNAVLSINASNGGNNNGGTPRPLAFTGTNTAPIALSALALILAGLALTVIVRRKEDTTN